MVPLDVGFLRLLRLSRLVRVLRLFNLRYLSMTTVEVTATCHAHSAPQTDLLIHLRHYSAEACASSSRR